MAETPRQTQDPTGAPAVAGLQAAADQASAAFDYEKAAALYTQALARPHLPPELEYDLLAARALCHTRLGLMEALAADGRALQALAERLDAAPGLVRTVLRQAATALENARLVQGLEQRVAERTTALEQRAAELAVINAVQRALAAELDIHGIYEAVGEKLREIFNVQTVAIYSANMQTRSMTSEYTFEKGQRLEPISVPFNSLHEYVLGLDSTFVKNGDFPQFAAHFKDYEVPQGEMPKSVVLVPVARNRDLDLVVALSLQDMDGEKTFSDPDIRLLETLANSMSVALENARLFDEAQQRTAALIESNKIQAALYQIAEAATAAADMPAFYRRIHHIVRELMRAENFIIQVYEQATQTVSYPYVVDTPGELKPVPPMPIANIRKGLAFYVLQTGKTLHASSSRVDEMVARGEIERIGLSAEDWVGVPLQTDGGTIGVIAVQQYEPGGVYTEEDVRLLEFVAQHIATSLERARAIQETQRLLKETEQRAAELAIINSVQQGLAAQLDMQAIYDLVGDKMREIFAADVVQINIYDRTRSLLSFPYCVEQGERHQHEPRAPWGFRKHVLRTRQTLAVNENVDRLAEEMGNPTLAGQSAQALVFVPLLVGHEVIGIFSLQNIERERKFTPADVRLLTTLASSMSIALENARLFNEVQKRNQEISAALEQQTATSEVLRALSGFQPDLRSLLEIIAVNAAKVCAADDAHIYRLELETLKEWTHRGPIPGLEAGESLPLNRGSVIGRAIVERRTIHIRDAAVELDETEYPVSAPLQRRWGYRTVLATPLLRDGEPLGGIAIRRREVQPFTEKQIELIQTFANQAVIAIENARLFDETRRLLEETTQRNAELAVINSVQQGLAAELDFQGLVNLVGDKLREVLRTGDLGIRLYDAATGQIHFPYEYEHGQRLTLRTTPLDQSPMLQRMRVTRQPIVVNADLAAQTNITTIPGTDLARSLLAVPILTRGETTGMIIVENFERENAFGEADTRLLTTLSASLSVALENARLFDETRRRASEMAALTEIGREVSASLDLNTVLARISTRARELLAGDAGAVYLLEADGLTLTPIVVVGKDAEAIRANGSRLGAGLIGQITASRQAEIVLDSAKDPRGVHIAGTSEEADGEQMMVAPLLAGEHIIGAMSVWRTHARHLFGPADLNFLAGLGRQAAIAIQNARLFAEVERQQRYSEALVTTSPVAIITTDLEDRVASWNPGAERLFGYTAAEAGGRRLDELVARLPELRAEAEARAAAPNTLAAQGRLDAITRRTRKDGTLVDVELAGMPVVVDGRQVGHIAIYHDITDLQRARQEAELANQAKSAFLATMSHEIRTPMNAVIGMSGLLLDTPLTPEQREFAEIIRASGDALLGIINDILDFSKIEAGKLELERQPFDLRECVESALDLVAARAFDKGLDLAYDLDERLPAALVGDAARLRQVLLNTLTNAVKFTDHGEVVLTIKQSDDIPLPTTNYQLLFSIRDTGVGIPPDRMSRLFQSFSQVDASTARKYGGTGLGLAISRRLVELMGGAMWAESQGVPGQGATFCFTLRAEAAPGPAPAMPDLDGAQDLLAGKRVLIVDDNDTNRRLLSVQTQRWGMQPRETASPHTALAWVQAGEPFDVAVLDMHMPEMDGLTLARALRQTRGPEALPLVLFTSLGRRELTAGGVVFAAHLTKPLKPSALYSALVGVFVQRPAPRAVGPAAGALVDPGLGTRHPLRLLLAEDNVVNQKLALRLLQQMGYRADVAANGLEALAAVERQPYDVILMDVQMPEMDGLEATRQLTRRWPRPARPRVIAMTANAMPGDREMCLAAGMDDYLSKPIRVEALAESLLNSPPRPAPGQAPGQALEAPPPMTLPVLDPAALDELAATTDAAFVRELIDTFLDDTPRLLAEMRRALAGGEAEPLRRAAHSLKGNAASLGAPAVSALAKALEQSGKGGQLAEAGPQLERLETAYAALAQALKDWPDARP